MTFIHSVISSKLYRGLGITLVALLVAVSGATSVTHAEDFNNNNNDDNHHEDQKVNICHWNSGHGGSYNSQSVDANGSVGGHNNHSNDIIPPFDYTSDHHTHHYPGKNWDATHQAIYNNNCVPPPQTGHITLVKIVAGDGAPNAATDWTLSLGPVSGVTGSPSVTNAEINPGAYLLGENGPAGYAASDWVCTGTHGNNGNSLNIAPGDNETCTITNTYDPGSITVTKEVHGAGDQQFPSEWSFDFSGSWSFALTNGSPSVTENNLVPGSYNITEGSLPENWYFVSADCGETQTEPLENGVSVSLGLGQQVSCTFTNEYRAPEVPVTPTATIHATKIVCPNEAELPNWSGQEITINADTAGSFLSQHPDCHLEPWDFEWSYGDGTNPGDNLTASGGAGWNAFVAGVAMVDLSNQPNEIHVREIPKAGYIPFVGAGDESDVSAEIYCSDDVLHYDNWDFVRNPQADTTYYCVAWNVPTSCRLDVVSAVGDVGVGNGNAVAAWIHPAWTHALEPFATWIWDTFQVNPDNILSDEAKTFQKSFYVSGPVTDANLSLAADNRYWITINGTSTISNTGEHNYENVTGPTDVASYLVPGWNTISIKVENMANGDTNPESNPAAGIYQLVINANAQVECDQPEKPICSDGIDNDEDGYTDYPNDPGCADPGDDDETNQGNNKCEGGENLLGNGGFESPVVTNPQLWDLFPEGTLGLIWDVRNISGNANPLAELQAGVNGWTPNEGTQYAELDSTEGTALSQDVTTTPDQKYDLNFYFSPRPGRPLADNTMDVYWGGTYVDTISADGSSLSDNDWGNHDYQLLATTTTTRLEFRYAGTSNSYGDFVDNVCLTEKQHGGGDDGEGTIIVRKEVTEGSDTEKKFNFFLTNYPNEDDSHLEDFALSDGEESEHFVLPTGMYSINEILDSHWSEESATCVSNLDEGPQDPDQVNLESGEILTCTFVNDEIKSTVTLCKTDNHQQPLAGWQVMLLGDLVQSGLTVDSTDQDGTDSDPLDGGTPYVAKASGTWSNQGGANLVDAEYSTTDVWTTHMDGYTGFDSEILELNIGGDLNVFGNWGAYNSGHAYAQGFTPSVSGPVNFVIFDGVAGVQNPGWFGDNSGTLNVDIYKGWVGTTGRETGCVTFNDVPYGSYTLDELMQDGWTNTYGQGQEVVVNEPEQTFTLVNKEKGACLVEGYKYDAGNDNTPIPGWTIGLFEGHPEFAHDSSTNADTIETTTTDKNGYYCLTGDDLNQNGYNYFGVFEQNQDGWVVDHATLDGSLVDPLYSDSGNGYDAIVGLGNYPTSHEGPFLVDFYNTYDPPILTIIKHTTGEQDGIFNFSLSGDTSGSSQVSTDGGSGKSDPIVLHEGTTTVTELGSSGWDFGSVHCEYNGEGAGIPIPDEPSEQIVVDNGDEVICTFTNSPIPDGGDGDNHGGVSGYKWNDLDGDGIWDENESGLAGWAIYIAGEGEPLASDITDGDGFYSIEGVLPGDYTLCEVAQNDWTETYPSDNEGCHSIHITADQTLENQNFGNHHEEGDNGDNDGGDGGNEDFGGGGGRSGGHRGNVEGSSSQGEVLGAQIALVPEGAPNTGAGGMAETGNALGAIFTLLGGLGLFLGRKKN